MTGWRDAAEAFPMRALLLDDRCTMAPIGCGEDGHRVGWWWQWSESIDGCCSPEWILMHLQENPACFLERQLPHNCAQGSHGRLS